MLIHWGILHSAPVRTALLAGGVTALVSGAVGVLVVIRGQSFAGHILSDMGTLGGASAFLAGIAPLWGFVGVGAAVAGTMELFGVERKRGRDVASGVVLGAALGLSALFLYWDTTVRATTGATFTILFGSLFQVGGAAMPTMAALALLGLVTVVTLYRPLLTGSISAEMAAAHGIRVRALGLAFLVLVGVTVSLTSMAVGTILSTALLIGPAATALRLVKRPGVAMIVAGALGLAATWAGVVLAYLSYTWPPVGRGWPVSFFVVTLVFAFYLAVDAARAARALCARRRVLVTVGR